MQIEITDYGPGILLEQQAQIFDRFARQVIQTMPVHRPVGDLKPTLPRAGRRTRRALTVTSPVHADPGASWHAPPSPAGRRGEPIDD